MTGKRSTLQLLLLIGGFVVVHSQQFPNSFPGGPRGQGNQGQCPQGQGQVFLPDPSGNCSRYLNCFNGEGSLSDCPPSLVFNPRNNICDWPASVQGCERVAASDRYSSLCAVQPPPGVQPGQAFNVPHPSYCNGFLTCGNGQVFRPCVICAFGSYFPDGSLTCEPYPPSIPLSIPPGTDPRQMLDILESQYRQQPTCQQRSYVPYAGIVNTRAYDPNCVPESLLSAPGQPQPQPQPQYPYQQGR
ncbi:uncharacterized protein LOC112575957 isoform X1 [Pomacea canaliculata]|uniref:uncharacterized protein LOC112575957 isoform X1 n=1 Tax=Pomacea canaliculata TaxID=400727 RepID=UPI000D72D405|nr:uncharacterized protein LOC112575957 isoform X1 [Pomacea canaliculata]